MKKACAVLALVAFGAFGQLWAKGSPATAWVPDDTDLLLVGHNLDTVDAKAQEAWDAVQKEMRALVTKDEKGVCAGYNAFEDVVNVLFGCSDDSKTLKAKNALLALSVLSPTEKGKESSARLFARIENPALKIAELDAAFAKAQAASGDKRAITRSGEWRVVPVSVAPIGGEKKAEADAGFFGYCPVEGGVLLVMAPTQADAEAIRAQKLPGLKAKNPLRAALKPLDKTPTGHFRLMVRDLADWVARETKASGSSPESANAFSPLVFKTHAISLAAYNKQMAFTLELQSVMDDEQSASELQEMLVAWKVALTQMILPAMLRTNDSQLGKIVQGISCKAQGKKVGLLLSVTPEQASKLGKELQALQQNITFTPKAPGGGAPDPIGALEQDDDDDGDYQISEEEARKILDGVKEEKR